VERLRSYAVRASPTIHGHKRGGGPVPRQPPPYAPAPASRRGAGATHFWVAPSFPKQAARPICGSPHRVRAYSHVQLRPLLRSAMSRPLAVFAYDFDGTLARGNMQEHAFIPDELGMNHADFWAETQALAEAQRGDGILAYMHLMLEKARE